MKKSTLKILILIGYFLIIFLLKKLTVFNLSFSFLKSFSWELVLWFGGAIIGANFIKIDLWLENNHLKLGNDRLASRSVLFQIVWVGLAIFILTSTNSLFGQSLVIAIGLNLLVDEWESYLAKKDFSWLFWQIKRIISPKEQKWFLYIMTGIFIILSVILI